jgi:hypothetical protein
MKYPFLAHTVGVGHKESIHVRYTLGTHKESIAHGNVGKNARTHTQHAQHTGALTSKDLLLLLMGH